MPVSEGFEHTQQMNVEFRMQTTLDWLGQIENDETMLKCGLFDYI